MYSVFEYCFFFLFLLSKGETGNKQNKARGVLIPANPPCANFQFAAMAGRELTCGDFHACGISAAAGLQPPLKAVRFRRLRCRFGQGLPSPLAYSSGDVALRRLTADKIFSRKRPHFVTQNFLPLQKVTINIHFGVEEPSQLNL